LKTLVASIVGGVAVLATGTVFAFAARHVRAARRCFRSGWREAAKMRAHDLLLARALSDSGFNDYYYEREQDGQMREAIASGSNVIVLGEPLSGKTRAVLEALRSLPDSSDVAVLKEADFSNFAIPFHARRRWNGEIIVLDDIDRLATRPGFLDALEALVKRHAVLIATCSSGQAHEDKLSQALRSWESEFRARIRFEQVSRAVAREISTDAGIELPDHFYGPIGSIFLPLAALQAEYRLCTREEKWILKILRNLHISGAASLREGMPKELLGEVISAPTGPQLTGKELRTALDDLGKRGLLREADGMLQCEETFLERVVESSVDIAEAITQLVPIFRGKGSILFQMGSTALDKALIDIEVVRLSRAAITAFEEVVTIHTRDAFPMGYAATQNNLGIAYRTLAQVEDKANNCRAAITACEEALTIRTRDAFPMDYAMTQNNLGNAYRTLAEVEDKANNCRAAITAYEEALTILSSHQLPQQVAVVRRNLQKAMQLCGSDE